MRRDRIKKTITYLSLLFWLCLLVACGQQEETTDDGEKAKNYQKMNIND